MFFGLFDWLFGSDPEEEEINRIEKLLLWMECELDPRGIYKDDPLEQCACAEDYSPESKSNFFDSCGYINKFIDFVRDKEEWREKIEDIESRYDDDTHLTNKIKKLEDQLWADEEDNIWKNLERIRMRMENIENSIWKKPVDNVMGQLVDLQERIKRAEGSLWANEGDNLWKKINEQDEKIRELERKNKELRGKLAEKMIFARFS